MTKTRCNVLSSQLLAVLLILLFGVHSSVAGEESKKAAPKQRPPSLVEVKAIKKGTIEPLQEMVGTVSYVKVSRVAAEVSGIVQRADFEAGDKVDERSILVTLNSDILDVDIELTQASFDQVEVELIQASKNLQRVTPLYKEGSVSESVYDEPFYKKQLLEKKKIGLQASLDRLLLEKKKKHVEAPFNGIILEKMVEKGEWVSGGGTIGILADDTLVDIEVEVPSLFLAYLKKGQKVDVVSGGKEMVGRYVSFIPRGDVATRTFTVKIRLNNNGSMVEGMEARAHIPSGAKFESLLVPRDAIVKKFGRDAVFVESEGQAKMVAVTISGYSGMQVGISGSGLFEGQQVVVKGNERLFGGETLAIK